MSKEVKLASICPVFLTNDVLKTTEFYVNVLGFKYAKHYDKKDSFSTVYRDSIEIVIIQKKTGTIDSNIKKYGNGEDAYIVTDTVEGVDIIYKEFVEKGVKIINEPKVTDYGSYEFTFEDIDGRNIGIGRIKNEKEYFVNSNYTEK